MRLRTKKAIVKIEIEDVVVEAEQLTPKEIEGIRDRHTTYKGRGKDRRAVSNEYEITFEMFSRLVKNWTGATNESGDELSCTTENKRKVFEHDQSFVADVMGEIADTFASREEAVTKN